MTTKVLAPLTGEVPTATKAANYAVGDSDLLLRANCAGGNIDFTLPVPVQGRVLWFKKVDGTTNRMRVLQNAAETIDGSTSIATTIPNTVLGVCCGDGVNWDVI